MKIKTSELTGAALDWVVANLVESDGRLRSALGRFSVKVGRQFNPSVNWSQGGPIIDREKITTGPYSGEREGEWQAYIGWDAEKYDPLFAEDGPTPLIAAMRAFVASKLGDEVDVPEALK